MKIVKVLRKFGRKSADVEIIRIKRTCFLLHFIEILYSIYRNNAKVQKFFLRKTVELMSL